MYSGDYIIQNIIVILVNKINFKIVILVTCVE